MKWAAFGITVVLLTTLVLSDLEQLAASVQGTGTSDALVSVGSPPTPFPQSWQNTPALAVDPMHPDVLVAAAHDSIDTAACGAWDNPRVCPFGRVGFSGVYFSFDGGSSWMQPTYTGLTRRHCIDSDACQLTLDDLTAGLDPGPIGTVPHHDGFGVYSQANPAVTFGPVPGLDGTFSWDNGSRLYHAHQIVNLDPPFGPGLDADGATAVSTIDGDPALTAEIVADQASWTSPVIATRHRPGLATWAPVVWADNAESSPFFGRAYVCDVLYGESTYSKEQIVFAKSTDGGRTWTTTRLTTDDPLGLDYCHIRTDSRGTIYVFWEATHNGGKAFWFTRSLDGGESFEPIRRLASGLGCYPRTSTGPFAVEGGSFFFDGARGVESPTYPSVDIANGAPSGADATDRIVLVTCKDDDEPNSERALVFTSTDGGDTWSRIANAAEAGDRPDLPAIAISPDGEDVYLVYQGFLDPWQSSLTGPRRMQAVVRHAEASDLSTWTTLYRGVVADTRASSYMSFGGLKQGYLGIYQAAIATRDAGIALWTDIRNAERCPAIEAFRQSLVDGDRLPVPAVGTDCPPTFGNSDIYGAALPDPS